MSGNGYPQAHTCFFELDLGRYDTDEELDRKLRFGIDNCTDMYDSGSAVNLGVGEVVINEW